MAVVSTRNKTIFVGGPEKNLPRIYNKNGEIRCRLEACGCDDFGEGYRKYLIFEDIDEVERLYVVLGDYLVQQRYERDKAVVDV